MTHGYRHATPRHANHPNGWPMRPMFFATHIGAGLMMISEGHRNRSSADTLPRRLVPPSRMFRHLHRLSSARRIQRWLRSRRPISREHWLSAL